MSATAKTLAREKVALRTGDWPEWVFQTVTEPQGGGWLREVGCVYHNKIFAVLCRVVQTSWGEVTHAAIRNVSETDIAWRDMQRIKNDLFGEDAVALEVFPPTWDLVDEANMYHLWVLPDGFTLPFTLSSAGHRRPMPLSPDTGVGR